MERRRLLGGFGCLLAAAAGCVTADRDDPAGTGDGDETGEETNGSTTRSRSDDESDREPESDAGGVDSDGNDGDGQDGDAPADGSDEDDDRSDSTGSATELTGRRVETRSQDCLEGDSEVSRAAVTREDSETIVNGAAQTSNPCHEAAFERVAYDADAGVLTVNLTFESTESICKQCVGVVEYRCVFEFAGGLPERVVVRHDGQPVTETA